MLLRACYLEEMSRYEQLVGCNKMKAVVVGQLSGKMILPEGAALIQKKEKRLKLGKGRYETVW